MSEPSRDPADMLTASTEGDPSRTMNEHAVSGVIWSMIHSWGGRLMSTVVFVVLGRLLSPRDFGLVALGLIVVDLGALITVSGFHRAIVQREDLEREHLDAAFWSSAAIGTVLCLVTMLAAGPIATLFGEPQFAAMLRVLSIIFVITGVGAVPSAILHRRMAFRAMAVRQLATIAAGSVIGVTLAVLGAGAWALVGQALASGFAGVIVVMINARWRPRLRFSPAHWRDIAGFGSLSLGVDLLNLTVSRLDDLLIGLVLGSTALGYYGVAFRTYAIALELVAYSLGAVAFPIFSRLMSDRARAARAVITTTKFSVCVTLAAFVGLAAVADNALIALFGGQWQTSVTILRLLCVSAILSAGTMLFRDLTLAAGLPRVELAKAALCAVLFTSSFAVGVQWGLVGVAAGRVVAVGLFVPIDIYVMRRLIHFDVRQFVAAVLRPVPACALMFGTIWWVKTSFDPPAESLLWLFGLSLLGLLTYSVSLWFTARATVSEVLVRFRRGGGGAATLMVPDRVIEEGAQR
jgi:PST family polysaccharide transporter